MSTLPTWARKPKHKKEVVATPRGWMLKETGEYLKLVKDLDQRLKDLHEDAVESFSSIEEQVPESTIKQDEEPSKEGSGDDVDAPKTEEKEEKTKRRGRPRKNKQDSDTDTE